MGATRAARPFRFGVQASGPFSRAAWLDLARAVEGHGYSTLTMPDHFTDQLAPMPALTAAAAVTEQLRVGALVWANDYKHPVVLAKELATLDVLSDGRLEIGLGTGWMTTDYARAGLTYDRPGVRIERFVEALRVLDGAFADGPFSFAGRHYRVTDYDGKPTPVQRPRPPLLIGAGGPRLLAIAAREADIVGINATLTAGEVGADALASMAAEAVDAKVAVVREAAGSRSGDLELNIRAFYVEVTDDREKAAADLGAFIGFTGEQVLASPFALIGTAGQIADDLSARRERYGFSYVIVGEGDVDAIAPVVAELIGT